MPTPLASHDVCVWNETFSSLNDLLPGLRKMRGIHKPSTGERRVPYGRQRGDTLGGIVQRQQPLFQARGVSLLQTDGPKLVFKSAGLGVRHQREAGCFAPLDIREFLSRYCGTIYSPAKPAHDD